MSKINTWALPLLLLPVLVLSVQCHRAVEPYDPDEEVEAPDLSKIFPPGSERTTEISLPDLAALPDAPATRGDPSIQGEIQLAEGATAPSGAVLFVIARNSESGPPVAVKRVSNPSFPLRFQLGPGDRMIESVPFKGPFQLSARLDGDGNAATRQPGDLSALAPGSIAAGARGVDLLLTPPEGNP